MASSSYAPVKGDQSNDTNENLSPHSTPRLGEMDLGRMSFFENGQRRSQSRSGTPLLGASSPTNNQSYDEDGRKTPASPGLNQAFSSAQSYAPLSYDSNRPTTPGTPGTPGNDMLRSPSAQPWLLSAHSDRRSQRFSIASSHMLANSDYGSQHQLTRYTDSGAIPMQDYEKNSGSRVSTPGGGPQYMPVSTGSGRNGGEKYSRFNRSPMTVKKKWWIFAAVVIGLILLAIVIAIPLVVVHDRQHSNGATVEGTGPHGEVLTSGGNGTEIRMENGTTFTYINNFGGEWRSDLNDDGARAQNYTPPLSQTWDYTKNGMMGVNVGGWLVIEPFIAPALFEPYENDSSLYVVDEYTLMNQWFSEGGQSLKEKKLRQHYDTFITEYDFMMIAAAGLNWIRLPIAYWAIATMPGEPFVQGMSWEYFLKAVKWARKYGLRIELDLHAIPGSQNGYNHGGRLGVFNFLNSPVGMVSAQRALDTIRVIAEFVAQPEIAKVIPVFGVLNEPNVPVGIGQDNIRRFYIEAYSIIRNITGLGQNHGPMLAYHDGFLGLQAWSGFMQGADRISWDLHPYVCFTAPFYDRLNYINVACNNWAANTELGLTQYGVTLAGEWSLAPNDCGLFLNGPFQGTRYDGTFSSKAFTKTGDCGPFDDWETYSNSTKQTMYQGAIAAMSSFQNFFFWTWKIGDSLRTGKTVNPNWSYSLGLQQGWMPKDPYRESQNACRNLQSQGLSGITKTAITWSSTFADYQTGAATTYTPSTASYSWPPPSITVSGQTANILAQTALPTYTPTGTVMIPPTPTYSLTLTKEVQPTIDPWTQGGRQTPAFAPIAGCTYFDSIWNNYTSAFPGWPCGGSGGSSRRNLQAMYEMDLWQQMDKRNNPFVQEKDKNMNRRDVSFGGAASPAATPAPR